MFVFSFVYKLCPNYYKCYFSRAKYLITGTKMLLLQKYYEWLNFNN